MKLLELSGALMKWKILEFSLQAQKPKELRSIEAIEFSKISWRISLQARMSIKVRKIGESTYTTNHHQ